MRRTKLMTLAILATGWPAFAMAADSDAIVVRYAVNMDFLPPLTGERTCVRAKRCDIVKLDHFGLTLILPADQTGVPPSRLTIDCDGRECALKDGLPSIDFRKTKRFVRFKVDDREYALRGRAVQRYAGDEIGEILLAY